MKSSKGPGGPKEAKDHVNDPDNVIKDFDSTSKPKKTALLFDLEPLTKVKLIGGKFYVMNFGMKNGDGVWKDTFLFSAPMTLHALVKQGNKWKIRYEFDSMERLDSIDAMLSLLSNSLRLDRNSSKFFAQFIYKFKTERETEGMFELAHEPIGVENDVIKVNRITEQQTKEILQILTEIHTISTYPDSFIISLCYDIIAPFSYEIRSKGQKFPYRLGAGKTHGGKTSDQILLTLKGFDQTIGERKESLNTIKTIFTFGQQVEKSRLPLVVDDINNQWLGYHSEELKGATDSVKFMARGTKAQTQIVYDMVGMPIFTMNEEPSLPLALRDRIILSHYTEEHRKRQNKQEFERLSNRLQHGFMFNLIKETMEGKTITEILNNTHYSVKTDEEINQKILDYAHGLLSDLCKKYGLEFPDNPVIDIETKGFDLLETFCIFVATRYSGNDKDGQTYQKFSMGKSQKNGPIDEMRITGPGYNEFLKEYRIRGMDSMTDFINEMKNPEIRYESRYIPTLKNNARCIVVPLKLIRNEVKWNINKEDKKELFGENWQY